VGLPKVMPPRTPRITAALGGERQIQIRWASNREADLADYLIYRTETESDARDVRLMTLAHTEPAPAGDPNGRPAENSWTDDGVPGLATFYYQMVAVDTTGNASAPSPAVAVRAHDESLPTPPPLTAAWDAAAPPSHAVATWTSTDETRLERRAAVESVWTPVGDWQPAGDQSVEVDIDPGYDWQLRLRVRKYTGATAIGPAVDLTHAS
jgi:hypothetical protein